MVIAEIIDFLKKIPPFQFLDDLSLSNVAGSVSVEFYPKGQTILAQDGPPSDYLRIIKRGGVKVFLSSSDDEDVLIDYRSEGDSFGMLSLVGGDKSRANVVAVEDTLCYLIDKNLVLRLVDSNPTFTEFFLKSVFNKYIDKTYQEIHARSLLCSGGDKLMFSTPVSDIASKEIITAPKDISIREAARIMSSKKISSLVLADVDGSPVGIVTDRDLREKVVAKGRDVADPISTIMSVSLIKADAREFCFEALLKMIRYNIHHLLVVDNGKFRGIVTNHDLVMLQGTSPISIAKDLENQYTIEGLVPVTRKINKIIGILLKEGAKASNITRIITELNDRLFRKILKIAEEQLGPPPARFCWIVFGSEGRKEQTFKTDQDNAIIYEDLTDPRETDEAVRYFSELALFVNNALLQCGFPTCPARYMASNPQWCQPLRVWKKYFSNWISEPTGDAVLKSLIFFDFRALYGDCDLSDTLRDYLHVSLEDNRIFLGSMANTIIKNIPPIGFFKTFVVEKTGEHKDELNLKVKGIAPLVDTIRLFSLEKGVRETSTLDRIRVLRGRHPLIQEYADEIEHAFEFIMLLRIERQYEQIEEGGLPDNFINPDNLSNLEKRIMKEAFQLITSLQDFIIERYKASIL